MLKLFSGIATCVCWGGEMIEAGSGKTAFYEVVSPTYLGFICLIIRGYYA